MHQEARDLVEALGLVAHPEGGFFRETFRAARQVGERAASTAIYFLLPSGTFSALHRVSSDEVWHHYQGDPLDLHTIDGAVHRVTRLGQDIGAGERPQHVVPAGVWQAAVPRGDRFALCGCTVAPGFDFADFEMPPREELLRLLPNHAAVVAELSRSSP